jgi:hypothetical protein
MFSLKGDVFRSGPAFADGLYNHTVAAVAGIAAERRGNYHFAPIHPPFSMIAAGPRRQLRRNIAAIALAVVSAACDDATGSVPSEVVGSYTLTRVNGMALPVRVTDSAELQVDVLSGAMNVVADGSYRETRESRITDASGTRTGSSFTEGTLRVSGTSIEVRERLGGSYSGTISPSTLSYSVTAGTTSVSFTFQKDAPSALLSPAERR